MKALRLLPVFLLLAAFTLPVSAQSLMQAPADEGRAPVWLGFGEALEAAKKSEKLIIVDVWSARCGWCARMQREVYTQPDLLDYIDDHFETGRLDIDIRTDTLTYMGYELSSADLSVGFGATGTPTTIFLDSEGTYLTRLPGFHTYERFIEVLRFMATDSFRTMSFEDYQATKGTQTGG